MHIAVSSNEPTEVNKLVQNAKLSVDLSNTDWVHESVTGWKLLNGTYDFYEAKRQCELKPGGYLLNMNRYRSALLPYMLIIMTNVFGQNPLNTGSAWIGLGKVIM